MFSFIFIMSGTNEKVLTSVKMCFKKQFSVRSPNISYEMDFITFNNK
jgi:hypothetical protein